MTSGRRRWFHAYPLADGSGGTSVVQHCNQCKTCPLSSTRLRRCSRICRGVVSCRRVDGREVRDSVCSKRCQDATALIGRSLLGTAASTQHSVAIGNTARACSRIVTLPLWARYRRLPQRAQTAGPAREVPGKAVTLERRESAHVVLDRQTSGLDRCRRNGARDWPLTGAAAVRFVAPGSPSPRSLLPTMAVHPAQG
jgi:hypothetical protein